LVSWWEDGKQKRKEKQVETAKKPLTFDYDLDKDVMHIEGIAYSGDFFRAFSRAGVHLNKPFIVTQRTADGCIVIEDYSIQETHNQEPSNADSSGVSIP
jgi:hypothetical protein